MTARAKQSWAALTDIGRVRTHNEDSVLAQPPLFVVADGLGGHEAGEVASSIAVETLRDHAPRRPDAKALARAVKAANREVIRSAREGFGKAGMGTTMTAAIVEGTKIAIAHVGDSRAYLLHEGALVRVSEDHSMVADMIRRGQLTEAESRYHPNRSVITRALGTDPNMLADTYEVDASPGDRLLLCSDGLTTMLEDGLICEILEQYRTPDVAARMLIDTANEAGGHDNISVIVIDIEGTGSSRRGSLVDATGARSGRGWLAIIGWVLLFALAVGGASYGAYTYARSRAYFTVQGDSVNAYQGVPGSFAGIQLTWALGDTGIHFSALPTDAQAKLKAGVEFPLADLSKMERLYSSQQASSTAPAPSAPTSATVGATSTTPATTPTTP
ncbi:MAG: Stp1/IreP family PP2C-type Ser/Thr phosphatase [Coriobacteriia bacterium]|nr:Stp1/IreP family PP2C-type Ser/Thr phosphatase [Coriobacteriia bacterium]